MRVRRSTEMSTSGGSSETDMNAFAVMPCTWSRSRVVITVTPVANMPERAPQRDPRVVAHLGRQLQLGRLRDVVEAAVAEPVGPRPHRVCR